MKYLLALSLTLFSVNCFSAIIDNDWYTTDTSNGLEWLDVTLTLNATYDEIRFDQHTNSSYAKDGWYSAGWRHATTAEVQDLLFTFDSNYCDCGYSSDNNNAAHLFTHYLGDVVPYYASHSPDAPYLDQTYGMTSDASGVAGSLNVSFINYYDFGPGFIDTTYLGLDHANERQNYVGHFLVRDHVSVPEPGSLALLSLGLIGMASLRKRK